MYKLWAGTEDSLSDYYDKIAKFESLSPKDFPLVADAFMETEAGATTERLPRLLSIQGGIGILSIHGELTDSDNWYNRYAGLVAYSEIREAVVTAIAHPDVKELLVFGKTPGGVVAGLHDTYEFMAQAQKLIPMTLYTDSMVASAGYWITAPIKNKVLSADATIGSIGIIMHHMERSKMLEDAGIKVTVIRAGEFKGLGNAVEPLTDKAKAVLEERASYLYGIFVQAVADSLKTSYQAVDSRMAQGRLFIGAQAIEVGLATEVSNFDAVIRKIQARLDKKESNNNLGGYDMTKRYALSATSLAAIQAGASLADMKLEELPGDVKAEGDVTPEVKAEGAVTPEVKAEGAVTPEVKAEGGVTPEVKAEVKPDQGVIDLLKSQLAAKDDEVINAKMEAKALKDQVTSFTTTLDSLKGIVANTVSNMQVALGGGAFEGLEKKDAGELVALHASTLESFVKNFKVGGVSGSAQADEVKEAPVSISRMGRATLTAVK